MALDMFYSRISASLENGEISHVNLKGMSAPGSRPSWAAKAGAPVPQGPHSHCSSLPSPSHSPALVPAWLPRASQIAAPPDVDSNGSLRRACVCLCVCTCVRARANHKHRYALFPWISVHLSLFQLRVADARNQTYPSP